MFPRHIILVGPMGAGKTTIGKLLSSQLHYNFVDTDHLIEQKTGADIPWIFDVEGEAGFREREQQTLLELADIRDTVIATGGGIVLKEANRARLHAMDCVIYLQASIEQLLKRTAKDKKRPLLQVDDPKAKIQALLKEREPLYLSVADYSIKTDGQNPKSTVQMILDTIQSE